MTASSPNPDAVSKIGDLAAESGLRRIHLLSWRDLEDVEAGGSEIHAAEVGRCWADAGIEVTWRSSFASGQPSSADRDGYRVIRRAGRYLVFPRAAVAEVLGRHGPSDALLEIWNGMPFFSPLWYRGPSAVMLHHVHAEMWKMVLGDDNPALAWAGNTIERRIAPVVYRRSQIITPSESAREEIVSLLGLPERQINVVHNGLGSMFRPGGAKTHHPSIVAVGRLVPVKRHDLLINAAAHARTFVPDLTLTIVGEGYEHARIAATIQQLGAEEWVHLAGRVDEPELIRLYQEAWLAASASAREGWGLSLTESAACGTPAVATDIAGHRDAVRHEKSGLLVAGTAEALGGALAEVLRDEALRSRLSAGALERVQGLSWEATALGIMRTLADQAPRHRR
ncbi:MAG: glycosyltransferase family 4 protein [Acidimicrobiales bacterium]